MPEPESLNTMFHHAFIEGANGSYALQITGTAGGGEAPAPLEVVIPVVARATSITAHGKVAAPAALGAIVATAALDLGTWDIEIKTFIGGTTVANVEMDNMELMLAGAAKSRIINPIAGTTGATSTGGIKFRYDGAGVVSVRANGAATAASIYAATIIATRVN